MLASYYQALPVTDLNSAVMLSASFSSTEPALKTPPLLCKAAEPIMISISTSVVLNIQAAVAQDRAMNAAVVSEK